MRCRRSIAVLVVTVCLVAGTRCLAAVDYSVIDVGAAAESAGQQSTGLGVDDAGDVVGATFSGNSSNARLFLHADGVSRVIGSSSAYNPVISPAGAVFFRTGASAGTVINTSGLVMDPSTLPGWNPQATTTTIGNGGLAGTLDMGGGLTDVFVFSNGVTRDLGDPGPRYSGVTVAGINSSGDVVGSVNGRAFVYSDGRFTTLGTFDPAAPTNSGFSEGEVINDHGAVAGIATANDGLDHVFEYANGVMVNLGVPAGDYADVHGMNDAGEIVGEHGPFSDPAAFVYRGGVFTDLNSLVDPALGWDIFKANGVNSEGQIAAAAKDAAGNVHALLLTPVPEPASAGWVMGLGVGWLGRRAERRRTMRR